MYYDSLQFKAMQGSLNALSLQQKTILHNLANYETPGYKTKTVTFDDTLRKARGNNQQGRYNFQAVVTTDEQTSLRLDGNNVDSDAESLKLYENYVQTLYLYQKIGAQFSNIRYVLNNAAK